MEEELRKRIKESKDKYWEIQKQIYELEDQLQTEKDIYESLFDELVWLQEKEELKKINGTHRMAGGVSFGYCALKMLKVW